jgi:L-iditol 2-dehydrogenase
MRAAILVEYKKVEIRETPEPVVGPNDILVAVMACGLCPTDYRLYAGIATWKKPPMMLGHEPSGVVTKVGSEVKEFALGDKVAGDLVSRCGNCKECNAGRENLCHSRKIMSDGALAEFIVINKNYANKFSNATFEEACFTEPLACVLNSIKNSGVTTGDVVTIIGSGQIGLMHMQVANLLGAETVMIDVKNERLEAARRLGASYIINSNAEDPVTKIEEIVGKDQGVDKVIVATGNISAAELGMRIVGRMGTVNLFGSINPPTKLSFDPNIIHHGEISLIGSFDKTRADLRLATRLIEKKKIQVNALITHRFSLQESQEAFEMLEIGAGTKVVVKPNKEP